MSKEATARSAMKLALDALELNRRTHYYCEDTWYSCPKHEDGCANEAEGDECNCGADQINAQIDKAVTALRQALANEALDKKAENARELGLDYEPAQQEPVARQYQGRDGVWKDFISEKHYKATLEDGSWPIRNLYTSPQSKPWVGLTDEEINAALDYWSEDERSAYGGAHAADGEYVSMIDTWRYIEAKLKEKNT